MAERGAEVETESLWLRLPGDEDADGYRRVLMSPEVQRWLRPPPEEPFSEREVGEWLADDVRHWNEHGFGAWALLEKPGGRYVGRAGIRMTAVEGEPTPELVWSVDPARHGRGYASEAAVAALSLARSAGIEELVALVLPENVASRRVAEKLGMATGGEVEHAGLPHIRYALRP